LLTLRVEQVDFANNELSLLPGTTKNREGRTVVMTKAMRELLTECCKDKTPDKYVFTWATGDPVLDFRELWTKVTKAAGVPELLVHDLRRTAVRNMRLRGVGEYTAMRLTGHKTTAVFRRYDIHSSEDLRDAALKLEG
jgi:integrase